MFLIYILFETDTIITLFFFSFAYTTSPATVMKLVVFFRLIHNTNLHYD